MRCIDADALLDEVMDHHCNDCDRRKGVKNGKYRIIYSIGEAPCKACDVDDLKDEIEDAPTIEPRCEACEAFNKTRLLIPQRKKGKWIYLDKDKRFFHPHIVKCSVCNNTLDMYGVNAGRGDANFCPNCGADMRTPVDIAKDIVHKIIDNTAWSDTVDTAKMHKVVDDKYAEMTKKTEESKRCDTCKHERSRWFSRCADCSDYELWEEKDETGRSTAED